ncbi:conserved mitochondrial Smc domain-containing protein [Andalucia godoyi]|uniref:Conserved mitochondrial Smc domain-containing protein n=1 Tax=Andalucia godoyi TaxID=505711 RepID=A0A8K0F452_ANDGO|nr:conserved mitochondrial Smc domain-containing protein [Andalucia godoyi]|eukprot:ANDGO_01635.mRNA.1 conserved mitochondrial Smc domain-containing protein
MSLAATTTSGSHGRVLRKRSSGPADSLADRLDKMLQPNVGGGGSVSPASPNSVSPFSSPQAGASKQSPIRPNTSSKSPRPGTTTSVCGGGNVLGTGMGSEYYEEKYRNLSSENESLKNELARTQEALQLRQTTYARKETRMAKEIATLKEQLDALVLSRTDTADQMRVLRDMNATIQVGIDSMQDKTQSALQAHEDELKRSFRAQLHEVEKQLSEERQRHMDGAAQYLEQIAQLKGELAWMKEEATRLDAGNQKYRQESQHLRVQYRAQEDDRTTLIKQIAVVKMENARLRDELAKSVLLSASAADGAANNNNSSNIGLGGSGKSVYNGNGGAGADNVSVVSKSHDATSFISPFAISTPRGSTMLASTGMAETVVEQAQLADMHKRYEDTVKRMRRLLETERAHLRQVRSAHVALLAERTELEGFLRQCIEDVRGELAQALKNTSQDGSHSPTIPPITKPADRQKVVETLLAKERVLALLYDKSFPTKKQVVTRLPAMVSSQEWSHDTRATNTIDDMSMRGGKLPVEEAVLARLKAFVEEEEEDQD